MHPLHLVYMTSFPVFVSAYPGKKTLLCPYPQIPLTAAHILPLKTFELKVLASVSYLYLVVCVGYNRLSATVSLKRTSYCSISHRSTCCVILQQILWALHAYGVVCGIIPMNTMGRSEFQCRSLAPNNYSTRHFTNCCPKSP